MGSGVEPAFLKATSLGQMRWNHWGMLVKDTTSVPLLRPLASEPPIPAAGSWESLLITRITSEFDVA